MLLREDFVYVTQTHSWPHVVTESINYRFFCSPLGFRSLSFCSYIPTSFYFFPRNQQPKCTMQQGTNETNGEPKTKTIRKKDTKLWSLHSSRIVYQAITVKRVQIYEKQWPTIWQKFRRYLHSIAQCKTENNEERQKSKCWLKQQTSEILDL